MTKKGMKNKKASATIKTIGATMFKQQCLALMDQVATEGIEFLITKHGKPFCKLSPLSSTKENRFGWLMDSVQIKGDITKPVDEIWDAE